MRIKIEQVNISIFSNQILLELKYCLFQFIQIKMTILIDLTYPSFIKYHNVNTVGKKLYYQPIDFDIKQYKEIRKWTTGQGEDYTTGSLLDYESVKNHDELIAVSLSRQKELGTDQKAIQQIEFVGQSKNSDDVIVANECMLLLMILEKIKKTKLKFS